MTISRILVPIDFGEASLTALDRAIDLAAKLDASVVVVHVYELPAPSPLPAGEFLAATPEDHIRFIATMADTLRGVLEARVHRGVELEALLREGRPWQVIDATAEEIGADLIVMGTREHGILHALMGGIAEKVVRTATTPVLTIRGPD
ncbi:MAG TPA: universal stress protein [Polyangiaceae bacterium]|jgi:nucleotide-binding universal stress UspA family protein